MKRFPLHKFDFSKVAKFIYHLPDGPSFSVEVNNLDDILDMELELGEICDTSDIDGVIHFFPKGNA